MNLDEFSKKFKDLLSETKINLNDKQIEKFYKYMILIQEWNEKINLTAILDPKDMIIKHFIDSLTISNNIKKGTKIIDVGTGAGFPGIPLKIYDDTIKITLLDSLNKRTIFLKEVIKQLDLDNVEIIHGRAEDFAHNQEYREKYDIAVSRAVAPLNVLLEYLVPYIKIGGNVIAMKGNNALEEISNSKNAMIKLKSSIVENKQIQLPENSGERYIIMVRKNERTGNGYPRKAGIPKRNPL